MKRFLDSLGQRRIDFALATVCGVILIFLQLAPFLQQVEWQVFDQLTRWTGKSRPLDPSLALVVIDDYSIDALGSAKGWSWPWPRGAYADMIAYLKACGAREIWIDLVFYTSDSDAFQDAELKAVSEAAGNVHFGQGENSVSLFQPTFNVALPPTADEMVIHRTVEGQHLLGWPVSFADLQHKTGVVTSAAFVVQEGEKLLRSLPADDRANPDKLTALWNGGALAPVAERFRDKIVYIGVSASSGYDLRALPVGTREPSLMIHVVQRSNQLQHAFFIESPYWLSSILILACCFFVSELFTRIQNFYRYAGVMLGVLGVIALISYLFFLEHIWIRPVVDGLAVAMTFTVITSVNYLREGRKRRVTEDLFGKFVSRKIVDRLVARPEGLKLGGEKAELTVLFSDLSGFTTLSESMPSDVLLEVLNSYLSEMSELIYEQEGTLDKYIGDAIMAFWGAPDPSPDHAWKACHAALACQQRLAELAPAWEREYGVKLHARIGINTDQVTVGLVGSNRLHNYSVIGDGVNLASRLEGANKPFGTSIMVAQRTVDLAAGKIEVRPIALLQVIGKTKPVTVYELLGRAGELSETQRTAQKNFTDAFAAFLRRDWQQAEDLLLGLLQSRPDDILSLLYLNEVRKKRAAPPGADWIGIFKLDEK